MKKSKFNRPQSAKPQFQSQELIKINSQRSINLSSVEVVKDHESLQPLINFDDSKSNQYPEVIAEAQSELKLGNINISLQKYETIVLKSYVELTQNQFYSIFSQCIKNINFTSIDYLNSGEVETSLSLLRTCEGWVTHVEYGNYPDLKALTYNNLGCIYRRIQQIKQAFMYFDQALKILLKDNCRLYLGLTYLNLSAMHSQIGNHRKALEFARQAIMESQYEFYEYQRNFPSFPTSENRLDHDEYINKIITMLISLNNVANEEEFFQNFEQAIIHYENSCNLALEYLGANHSLYIKFVNQFQQFYPRYAQFKLYSKNQNPNFSDLAPLIPKIQQYTQSCIKLTQNLSKNQFFSVKKKRTYIHGKKYDQIKEKAGELKFQPYIDKKVKGDLTELDALLLPKPRAKSAHKNNKTIQSTNLFKPNQSHAISDNLQQQIQQKQDQFLTKPPETPTVKYMQLGLQKQNIKIMERQGLVKINTCDLSNKKNQQREQFLQSLKEQYAKAKGNITALEQQVIKNQKIEKLQNSSFLKKSYVNANQNKILQEEQSQLLENEGQTLTRKESWSNLSPKYEDKIYVANLFLKNYVLNLKTLEQEEQGRVKGEIKCVLHKIRQVLQCSFSTADKNYHDHNFNISDIFNLFYNNNAQAVGEDQTVKLLKKFCIIIINFMVVSNNDFKLDFTNDWEYQNIVLIHETPIKILINDKKLVLELIQKSQNQTVILINNYNPNNTTKSKSILESENQHTSRGEHTYVQNSYKMHKDTTLINDVDESLSQSEKSLKENKELKEKNKYQFDKNFNTINKELNVILSKHNSEEEESVNQHTHVSKQSVEDSKFSTESIRHTLGDLEDGEKNEKEVGNENQELMENNQSNVKKNNEQLIQQIVNEYLPEVIQKGIDSVKEIYKLEQLKQQKFQYM